MDSIYRLGNGDIEAGTVAAFASGAMDIPFAPSVHNHGKILPMRDNEGFIRVFNSGKLALSDEILEFHREKLEQRAAAEGRDVCFQMVTDDIYAISKGRLVGRPR
jgi:methylaspartate mutase epsilon subunit